MAVVYEASLVRPRSLCAPNIGAATYRGGQPTNQIDELAHEDGLGCARGMFYALITELLLAIMGLLMWELIFR